MVFLNAALRSFWPERNSIRSRETLGLKVDVDFFSPAVCNPLVSEEVYCRVVWVILLCGCFSRDILWPSCLSDLQSRMTLAAWKLRPCEVQKSLPRSLVIALLDASEPVVVNHRHCRTKQTSACEELVS